MYYVSVAGIPSAAAANVLAVSKIFDGVSDLIMGRIVDKSNSKRGKALPWLIRMSIPMGICSIAIIGYLLTAVAGGNVTMVTVANAVKGAGFGFGAATMWGLLQDAITYGQWLTNVQAVGMGNAASSFTMKIGSGIGTAALGWILSAGNFDADPTSAAAAASLNRAYIWVPLITSGTASRT